MIDWHEIWERKGRVEVDRYDLETLVALDGYDGGAGKLSGAHFHELASRIVKKLELQPGMRVLEVGCGSGAVVWCLREYGLELYGVDYSSTLIDHARLALPDVTFAVAEADELPFAANAVDAVVCVGVFGYFRDYDYARRVLDEFARVAPVALVFDTPDLAKKEASDRARREAGSKPGDHLYYERAFFGPDTWDHDLAGYGNAPFRFNALCRFRA